MESDEGLPTRSSRFRKGKERARSWFLRAKNEEKGKKREKLIDKKKKENRRSAAPEGEKKPQRGGWSLKSIRANRNLI